MAKIEQVSKKVTIAVTCKQISGRFVILTVASKRFITFCYFPLCRRELCDLHLFFSVLVCLVCPIAVFSVLASLLLRGSTTRSEAERP